MAKAHTNSKITQSTVANFNIHKNTAMAPTIMQMATYTKENSDVDLNMVKVYISIVLEINIKVSIIMILSGDSGL